MLFTRSPVVMLPSGSTEMGVNVIGGPAAKLLNATEFDGPEEGVGLETVRASVPTGVVPKTAAVKLLGPLYKVRTVWPAIFTRAPFTNPLPETSTLNQLPAN